MSSDYSTHNAGDDATRLVLERLAFLRFMRQVLTPLPPEVLYDYNKEDADGEEETPN